MRVKKAINRHKFTEKKRIELKQEKGTWLNHRPNAHDGGMEGEEEARLIQKIGMKERGIQAQTERKE